MEKSNFDRLLQRYLTDQVSEKERIKIEAWLETMKTDDPTSVELSKEDEEKIFNKITSNINEETKSAENSKPIHLPPFVIGIAATLLVAVISFVLWNGGRETGVDKLILNDGTIVWLKGESNLIYYETPDGSTRNAELTGAGLFEVTKDPSRPFFLKCGKFTLKVLGTSFSVKPLQNGLEIEVLTGKVNLSSPADSLGIDVEANQKIIYKGVNQVERQQLSEADISLVTKKTEYNMQFKNASITDVLKKVEKKFEVTVKIDNNQIANCKITADFTDHSLESTMMMISEVLNVDYKINDKSITVSGSGCK